jgi:hypothetical protein
MDDSRERLNLREGRRSTADAHEGQGRTHRYKTVAHDVQESLQRRMRVTKNRNQNTTTNTGFSTMKGTRTSTVKRERVNTKGTGQEAERCEPKKRSQNGIFARPEQDRRNLILA